MDRMSEIMLDINNLDVDTIAEDHNFSGVFDVESIKEIKVND